MWGQNHKFSREQEWFFCTLYLPPCTYFLLSTDSAGPRPHWIKFCKTLNVNMCNLQELHCFLSSVFASMLLYARRKLINKDREGSKWDKKINEYLQMGVGNSTILTNWLWLKFNKPFKWLHALDLPCRLSSRSWVAVQFPGRTNA